MSTSSAGPTPVGPPPHPPPPTQQNKSSESKVKFRQASYRCKKVLEAAKFAYATKEKKSITSQKLGSQDFWWIANSVLNKR